MDGLLISLSSLILGLGGYIVWPSRYNIFQHLSVGGSFVSIVVPAMILNIQNEYPSDIVDLYIKIIVLGALMYLLGMIIGFVSAKNIKTNFTFDVIDGHAYEKRAIYITKYLMVAGIVGLILSYIGMGFVPMFAEDPISAKLFRGQYQDPYLRVAVIFRTAFFILSTVMPIACIIAYKNRSKLFLFLVFAALILMALSLIRSGAFMGVVIAFAVVMSFKSRTHFFILMTLLIGVFIFSSFFYYLVGVRIYTGEKNIWEIITAGTPDIPDHLDFMVHFDQTPKWTYGRTIYGGLLTGHYEWNPAVYTLLMVNPGKEINEIGSGGLRLPLPLWGYVSFQWVGVIIFSFFTGLFYGVFLRLIKNLFIKYQSILTRTVIMIGLGATYGMLVNFTQLSLFTVPPAILSLTYLYRFRLK